VRTAHRADGRSVAAKIMAGIGAVSLVASFALATLLRPFLSLGQLIMSIDQSMLQALDQAERTGASLWLWGNIAVPLLLRPSWMLPAMLGIVCVGAAAQLAWGKRR
jgi:hypothetical protein